MDNSKRRMLVSFAHPDDESFGIAGTIARYVSEGVEVYLICATNGDVGAADPEFMQNYETVADLRLAELRCAAQTLGLTEVITLGYRDSGMKGSPDNSHPDSLEQADLDEVAERITGVIRRVRPHVVVTFDPHGGYGHPDHVKAHQATVCAFAAAPDPTRFPGQIEACLEPHQPQKLYFTTLDRRLLRVIVRLMPLFGVDPAQMGRNGDINLYEITRFDSTIHARITTDDYTHIAEQARQCHASQLGGLGGPRRITERVSRLLFGSQDTYIRAYPPVNNKPLRETDLFEDVKAG